MKQGEVISLPEQKERSSHPEPAETIPEEISEWEEGIYQKIISTELSEEQKKIILSPPQTYPTQREILAVHWHPEFVPLDWIVERLERMFPHCQEQLVIPTQHNHLMKLYAYAGVEVDCYSSGFNRKVQLLLHFREENVEEAHVLQAMLDHTFEYRSSQLYEFIDTLLLPSFVERLQEAARKSNTDTAVVRFVQGYTAKLKKLLDAHWDSTPRVSIKNRLLRDFFDELRDHYDEKLILKSQVFLKAVKEIVKANFSLNYFYRASEVIEEARRFNAGVVIPHPEQFWPILLADYDVDGIEVWNPQSREYTEFLIQAVNRQNRLRKDRPLLVFMGDDCHMSEKVKDPRHQNPEKAGREIGLQPAWDDLAVRKTLIVSGINRRRLIKEYKERLA